ncbi:MAG TPA: hypothetical protein VFC26_15815, partial [Verrucomicrobiae bacterium]|nr:hypothetical protein [Verrucomicrobiae bacterium]
PVITTRMISSEVFRVKIGAPLTTTSEDRFGAIQGATNSFLTELEVAVKETPDQWRGWNYLEFG